MSVLEVCVDDVAGLNAAAEGGADRIELCASLDLGGVTASAGLMTEASKLAIPVIALIRPRVGGFTYDTAEERVMLRDIERAGELGLAGVAIGALTRDGRLDPALLQGLVKRAQGMQLTLHRAFDLVRDQSQALEEAIALGFHRILTSGGALTAPEGAAQIASLVRQARGRIGILAGSGITAANASELLSATGVQELHASCRGPGAEPDPELQAFGFAGPSRRSTSALLVRELRACMLRAVAPT